MRLLFVAFSLITLLMMGCASTQPQNSPYSQMEFKPWYQDVNPANESSDWALFDLDFPTYTSLPERGRSLQWESEQIMW